MPNESRNKNISEDNDQNKQEPHNPAEAGKKAIEAGKIANDSGTPPKQQQQAEERDADQWRNEG